MDTFLISQREKHFILSRFNKLHVASFEIIIYIVLYKSPSVLLSASVVRSARLIWKSYNVLYRLTVTYKSAPRS